MLGNKDVAAIISVKDLEKGRKFYEDTLGLTFSEQQGPDHLIFKSGNSRIVVYRSDYAGTNQSTAAGWFVGNDLDSIVAGLKAKGVVFEQYDIPGMTREGDIHILEGSREVWF